MPEPLSNRELQTLRVIHDEAARGIRPTLRELANALGLSVAGIHKRVVRLESLGMVSWSRGRSRSLTLTPAALELIGESPLVPVPLLGRLTGGGETLAEQPVERWYKLPQDFVGEGSLFMLQIRSDDSSSLRDSAFVVIREQSMAEDGEAVAARLVDSPEQDVVIRYVAHRGDEVVLLSAEPSHKAIIGTKAEILGKVVAVLCRM